MPSVTEVLDYLTEKELLGFFLNNSKAKREAISKEALRIGSDVDRLIQLDIKGERVEAPTDPKVCNSFLAWRLFIADHPEFKSHVLSIQEELRQGELIGHPDIIYEDEDVIGVIDIKTSRAIYGKYWLQTAKYLDMTGRKGARFIAVLRLDKETGKYEYSYQTSEDFISYQIKVFNAYLEVYYHNYNLREVLRSQLEREVLGVS